MGTGKPKAKAMVENLSRTRIMFGLLSLGLSLSRLGAPLASAAQPPGGSPTAAFSHAFRDLYRALRDQAVQEIDPWIVVHGPRVSLVRRGREVAGFAMGSPRFHVLKDLAHLPSWIFLARGSLASVSRRPPVDEAPIMAKVREAEARLGSLPGLEVSDQARAQVLLRESRKLLLVPPKTPGRKTRLSRYLEEIRPILAWLLDETTRELLIPLAKTLRGWQRSLLSPREWESLRVAIHAPPAPRRGYALTQFFAAILGDCGQPGFLPGEGGRILYSEQLLPRSEAPDEDPQSFEASAPHTFLDVYATFYLDHDLAQGVMGDAGRLHQDLMAPHVAELLPEILGGPNPCQARFQPLFR